jgi:hypothetical protein
MTISDVTLHATNSLVDAAADFLDTPCECPRPSHHPGNAERCTEPPTQMARIRHAACGHDVTSALCTDCFDELMRWASVFVACGACPRCGWQPTKPSDLVGPVIPL